MLLSAILNTFKPNAVDTVNVIYNNIWREIMKKLSITKMANTIIDKRKAQKLTQAQLAEMTHINRGMISRLESLDYTPSIDQLQAIAEVLDFEVVDLFEDDKPVANKPVLDRKYKLYNIPSTGLRFFTVYGPAGRPDMACHIFGFILFNVLYSFWSGSNKTHISS